MPGNTISALASTLGGRAAMSTMRSSGTGNGGYLRSQIESLSLWKTCFPHSFYAMALFGWNPEETIRAARLVEEHFPELKCPLFSRNEGADVIYRNVSKADGIRTLLDYYGMEEQDVVAFGDSMNDLEMIREAGIGVAMGNAVEALKAEADFVTKPIGEEGIRCGLEKLGLI